MALKPSAFSFVYIPEETWVTVLDYYAVFLVCLPSTLVFRRSEPIEQWEETFDPKKEEAEIKALTDRCKVSYPSLTATGSVCSRLADLSVQKHFSKKHGPRTPAQKAARRAALMKNVPGSSDVDEAMLDTATAMSMVRGANHSC